MRSNLSLIATLLLSACGPPAKSEIVELPSHHPAAGGERSLLDAGADSGMGGGVGGIGGIGGMGGIPSAPPIQLVSGTVTVVGVTNQGWVVFRDDSALRAVEVGVVNPITRSPNSVLAGAGELISTRPGSVLIRGNVVFNWADMDWVTGIGSLSIWSAGVGTRDIGPTPYSEGLIATSEQGTTIAYTTNNLAHTADLTLATNNFEAPPQVLIPAMGLGSETTCAPSIGFVGERLFVGWCQVDSRVAKIERYELVAGHWQGTLIASDCLPAWSADATGEHVFYQSSDYAAYVAAQGVAMRIDSGVSGGFLLPDASAAFYTVGDQLRRTSLPDVNPIPIVTKGYSQPVDFSPNFGTVLYSTIVTYTDGTQRDLRLVPTDVFNPEPIALVADPVAALPRSSITQDGRYVMYLTAMTPSGGSLHVATIDGTERLVLPNVVEVVAASGSTLVFTDSSSDPNLYPVVMDLKTIDLATETEPRLIEAKILDGHSFQLDQTRENVIYVRSGLDSDASAAEGQGLFVRSIR